jgi:uncharacterized protein (DUF302 family)
MMREAEALGFTVRLKSDFETALSKVSAALKSEGFGILTEIDVRATLKKKLDVDFRPYRILGACNPPLAYQALTAQPQVGLMLPCNVTVDQVEEGVVEVSIIDPILMMGIVDDLILKPIALEARDRLQRVARTLEEN